MTKKKKGYTLPPTITVGGMKFKIEFREMDDYGEMDFDKKIISIRKGLSPEDQLDTLIHECHHAALGISGLSNILDCENTEEALVRIVDYMVIPIVKQEYIKYINSK
jgi:hypothetical protein|tara:strand:- start:1681 stop:2001 length:321 start_codon:yes stop_codon:yes gene_type:complete